MSSLEPVAPRDGDLTNDQRLHRARSALRNIIKAMAGIANLGPTGNRIRTEAHWGLGLEPPLTIIARQPATSILRNLPASRRMDVV